MHHQGRATNDRPFHFADRLLEVVAQEPDGCVVMIATTERGCGSYGRLSVDPLHSIELRLFGWPRLVPGGETEVRAATEALERIGLRFDGIDWVWRRPFDPRLVPVAAHAAQRGLCEAWQLRPGGPDDQLVGFCLLDTSEVLAMAAGSVCGWCGGDCTNGAPRDHDWC